MYDGTPFFTRFQRVEGGCSFLLALVGEGLVGGKLVFTGESYASQHTILYNSFMLVLLLLHWTVNSGISDLDPAGFILYVTIF